MINQNSGLLVKFFKLPKLSILRCQKQSFPEDQREAIVEIVRHRLTEERREKLAQTIKEAREEYTRGEVRRGDEVY